MGSRARSYRWLVIGALAADLACLTDGRLSSVLFVVAVACVGAGAALLAVGGAQ